MLAGGQEIGGRRGAAGNGGASGSTRVGGDQSTPVSGQQTAQPPFRRAASAGISAGSPSLLPSAAIEFKEAVEVICQTKNIHVPAARSVGPPAGLLTKPPDRAFWNRRFLGRAPAHLRVAIQGSPLAEGNLYVN